MQTPHTLPLRLLLIALVALGIGSFAPTSPDGSARAGAEPAPQAAPAPAAPAGELHWPISYLPPPVEKWRIDPLTPEEGRQLWAPGCPIGPEQLRKLTLTYWDFDNQIRQGTLIVNESISGQTMNGFKELYRQRFPINRIDHGPITDEMNADPARWSTTAGYVCRSMRGSTKWSEHAYGTAFDINPYQNPMVKGRQVIGGGETYADRGTYRPGMLTEDSPAVRAFTDQGLVWGGTWRSSKDWMHFSANGH